MKGRAIERGPGPRQGVEAEGVPFREDDARGLAPDRAVRRVAFEVVVLDAAEADDVADQKVALHRLGEVLGGHVECDYAGLNHLGWVSRVRRNGEDVTEQVLASGRSTKELEAEISKPAGAAVSLAAATAETIHSEKPGWRRMKQGYPP